MPCLLNVHAPAVYFSENGVGLYASLGSRPICKTSDASKRYYSSSVWWWMGVAFILSEVVTIFTFTPYTVYLYIIYENIEFFFTDLTYWWCITVHTAHRLLKISYFMIVEKIKVWYNYVLILYVTHQT